eukprot:TRINITY_DN2747_c0_g1_i4.p1 TRINITY_DN2747_c0_g1~~TRINITY_DN2747_c0_g1_i4.p1  ORF type:complete len:258 (+),score=9.67 TRINITY_DN2747_c0_g1_i4:82-855(+)
MDSVYPFPFLLDELWLYILRFIDYKSIPTVKQVCSKWNSLLTLRFLADHFVKPYFYGPFELSVQEIIGIHHWREQILTKARISPFAGLLGCLGPEGRNYCESAPRGYEAGVALEILDSWKPTAEQLDAIQESAILYITHFRGDRVWTLFQRLFTIPELKSIEKIADCAFSGGNEDILSWLLDNPKFREVLKESPLWLISIRTNELGRYASINLFEKFVGVLSPDLIGTAVADILTKALQSRNLILIRHIVANYSKFY